MAAAVASACHSDPNFAVICCFLEKYGEILGLPVISFVDLQEYLEDTKTVSRPLIDLHVRLLKRIGKTNVNHERFERSVTKARNRVYHGVMMSVKLQKTFCFYFSDRDGWEMERFGYKHAQLSTKLRVLKNLLECQFDYNVKFKEKINDLQPEELRFLPAGRDRDGLTYWYLMDKDLNVHVYREEPDDETADTWKLICSDRDELASLLERLKNNTQRNFASDDKDDKSSIFTDESKTTSKEGSPDRDGTTPSLTLTSVKEETGDVKHEPPDDQTSMTSDDVRSAMSVDESSQVSVTSAPQPTTGSAGGEDVVSVKVKEEPVVQEAGDGGSGGVQLCMDGADTKALTDTRTVTTPVTTRTDTSPTHCHPARDQSSPSAANTASVTEHSCDVTSPHSHPSAPSHSDRQHGDPSDSVITTTITTGAPPHTPSMHDNTDRASREGGSGDSRTRDVPSPARTPQDPSPGQKGRDGGSLQSGSELGVPGGESQAPAGTSPSREGGSGQERGEGSHTVESLPNPSALPGAPRDSPELLQGPAGSSHSKTDRGGSSPGVHGDMGDTADLPCETAKEGVEKQTTSRGLMDQTETSSDRSPDRPLSADTEPMETKSSEEKSETKSSEEKSETKSSEEKETKSSEEKSETKSSEEKAETKSSEEKAETKSSEEKSETKSSEEKAETKSSEEKETKSSEEKSETKSSEEKETKSSEEKSETKSSEEKAETKSSEEKAETKSSEEKAETKSSEEKETKSSEEKSETKSSEEKETKSSEEKAETKSSEEKAETKSSEEKAETKSSEEKAETKSSEEKSETKSSEEKETKSSEDKPETKSSEDKPETKSPEDKPETKPTEDKPETKPTEEKPETKPAEQTLDSNKAEEKSGRGETKNTEEKCDGKESQTSGDKAGPAACPGEDAGCDVSSSEGPGQSSQGTAATHPQALQGSDPGTKDPPSCDQHQDQAATQHSPATDSKQPSKHSSHQVRPAEAGTEPTSPTADTASQKDSVHAHPEGQGSADGDQPSPGGEESMDTEEVCESSSAEPCVGTVPECEAKGTRPSDPGPALPGPVEPVTRAKEENDDLVSSKEGKEQTDTPPHTDVPQSASGEKVTDIAAGQSENDTQDKEAQPVGQQTTDEGDTDKDAKKEDRGKDRGTGDTDKEAKKEDRGKDREDRGKDRGTGDTDKDAKKEDRGTGDTDKDAKKEDRGQVNKTASEKVSESPERAEGSAVKGQGTEQESSSSETAGPVVKADPDSRAEVSGQQPASSVGPPDHTTDQQETMPSEDTGRDKSALPSSQRASADKDFQSHSSSASDTNQSVDVPQHSDEKSAEQEGETETGDHSADQCSVEGTGESQTLSSVQEGQPENRATAQTVVSEDSTTQAPTPTDSDKLTGKGIDLSSVKGEEQAKVSDNQAESVDTGSSRPTDKPSGETPADSKDNTTPKSPSNDKNGMAEMKDSKDSSVCGGDKEPGKPDSVEGEKGEEKTEGKDADPPRSRPLRKRRGKAAVKEGEAAEADSQKTPRTRGKRKGDSQDTPTDKQQGKPAQKPETENKTQTPEKQTKVNTADKQNKAKTPDKQNKANTAARQKEESGVKSIEDQEAEGLVNGHTDLLDDADDNNAHPQPSKTPRGRGRGRSRSRGSRGGRGVSRGAKRSAAQMEEEEASTAPAEKRAKRGGGKRRGAGGRGQQLAKSVGKEGESSSDSNTPLINCKGHSKPATARGPKKAAGSRKMADKDADSSSSDDLPLSKAAKKKKIVGEDSSDFEPDEPIAPCKKSRGSKTSKPATKTKKTEQDAAKKDDDSSTLASAYSTRRSLRIQTMKKKEPDPDFDILSEAEQSGELSSEVELPTEEDSEDDDFKPHQGRNRRRQAALKKKEEEKVPMDDTPCIFCEKCTHPDMMLLCDSCDKGYHMACLRPPLMAIPEGDWFCPSCEHVKLIDKLTEYLRELDTNSRKKDRLVRRKERLAFVGISLDNILKEEKKPVVQQRKRLTRDEEEEEEEDEEETEVEDNENDDDYVRPRRQKTKLSRSSQHRPSHHSRHGRKRHERQLSGDEEGGGLPEEVYAKRTCRTRSTVSYQFKEYDDLIKSAIQEDLSDPKPPRPPKPPGRNRGKDLSGIPGMYSDEGEEEMEAEDLEEEGGKGIGKDIDSILGQESDKEEEEEEKEKKKGKSRGKDMSNILGMDSDEEKELRRKQKEEALAAAAASEGRPPPVVKRKKQKRRLTMLDSDDNQDDEDDSEEFQISESDEDSEASAEGSQDEDDDDDLTEEDSGAWRPRRTWFNKAASRRGGLGKGGRRSRSSRFDNFVVDDDYDSDERASKRRSTRNSTKRRVRYRDWESDTEESEMETEESEASLSELSSDDSEYRRRKRRQQKSRKKFTSETETSGSEYMVKVNRAKKRRVASSDSEEDSGSSREKKPSKNKKPSKASKANSKVKRGKQKKKSSEDDSATEVEEEEAPKKKKNVLRDSSSEDGGNPQGGELEYGEDEDTEVEGDSQQPGPLSQTVSHKVTATGPQSEVKVTEQTIGESQSAVSVRDKAEAPSAVAQESVQGLEAAPQQTQEPEKAKGVGAKGRKARGKGKGKKAASQGEEGDRPERVECGTDVQDDIPVSLLKATPPALKATPSALPTPPALVKPASSAAGGPVVPQNPPPNFLHVEGPSGGSEGGDRARQNLPPHSAPPPPAPADLPFQCPPGTRFRPPLEGGVPPQFEPYPHPRPMGPQEGMRYPAPFPHGPYPLPGEGFRGPQPDRMPAPTPERFFRPQAMVPYEGEVGRSPSQAGVGRGDGFRPPFSQGERLHYPYRPPGPDSFQGVGRGFRPQGPHSEGSGTGVGPGQEGLRATGPVHPFHLPSSAGQTGFQPPTSSHDSFRPQLSGPDTHRATGQEGLAGVRPGHRPPGLESGHPPGHRAPSLESGHTHGHRTPGLESGHTPGQDQTQKPSQDGGPPSASQPEGLQQSGATEGMASPGAERFPMPGQKGFQPAQSAMERFRTPYPASEGFRPGQEGFGPPGAGQGFRFVQPSDFRPHGHPRASSVRPEVFQSPSAGHTRFPPAGPPQEGFLPGVRSPAANQGFKPPAPEGFRGPAPESFRPPAPEGFRGPAPESFRPPAPEGFRGPAPEGFRGPGSAPEDLRSSGPLQGFRPPVSGQERFGSPGPDTDRFRPHGPVSSFPGKGPGQKTQPTGPEGFQHAEPGQRFQTPAGSVQVSTTGQDIAQRMKVSESSKPSGTENLPTSSPSQDRAVPQGPAQAFPFQHGRYEAFPMGRGFWPHASSFSATGPHQGFWPPPGHPLRPSGPDSFPMVGHARGMHPSEHRPGFFPPAFRAAGMGEGGFPPGFRPPGQGEGLRPQEPSGGDQYHPPAPPYSKADPSAMQSAPVQDPAMSHGSSGHDFIHRQGGPAREEGREVNQGGAEPTARRGSSASEDSDNQPQDLTVQSHKPGPQGSTEQARRLQPCDPGGRREQSARPGSQVSDEASTPVDLSQQSKAPSLHSSQTDCPETHKSSGRDSAKPGDNCRSTASSEQGSEAQQTIPAAQGDQRPAVEGQTRLERRDSTEHTALQQQAEPAPSEHMPAPSPQPQTAARGSEETAARGPSGLGKAVTSPALSGQKEGSKVDRQPRQSGESNTAVAAGPKEGAGPQGLTAPEGSSGPLGPAQQPDRNLPQGPVRLTEQQEQSTPAVPPTQTEGESKATPVSPSSRAEGSEEPKPEKPSDHTEGHKGMEPAGFSEQRGGSAGSSLQTNSSQAEESRSHDPGQRDVPSPQVKDVKDGIRQDEPMLHQDSEPQESLKGKENAPQQLSVRNEGVKPGDTAELSNPVSSDVQIKGQGSAEGSTGPDQDIRQDAPASQSDELKSQDVSENKGEQRMDRPGPLGEGLKAPGSEDEKHKLPGPEGEGFRPPGLSGEGLRYAGPPGERFQPPGPLGEGFRPPGPSGDGFRPPGEGFRPPGEGFRPPGEGFRPPGPTGESFRPPGHPGDLRAPDCTVAVPSGQSAEQPQSGAGAPLPGSEGGKSQAHTDGFRPPASAAGTFQPPGSGHGGEGFRLPMGAEGFRPPGPEGFHPHAPEGFHARGFYPPFQGHPYYTGDAGQAFHAGFGMYPPHQFSSADPRMFGPHPGMGPHPYPPIMLPVSQVPGGPAGGRGGFMIDNLLRSKSGELPPPLMTPPVSSCAPHMTPPQSTPPHSTPPHGALPHATPAQSTPPHGALPHATPAQSTPPHSTPPHATPPHATPPHSTPPHCTPPHSTPPHCTPPQPSAPPSQHQRQMQQLQPLQSKMTATTVNSKGGKSPQPASQGEEGDDNDVSQIMSYVMNDDFFRQQTSS